LQAANTPYRFFRFAERLIRTVHSPDGRLQLQTLGRDELWSQLGRVAKWFKTKGQGWRIVSPPQHVVRDLLASNDLPFPELRRVIRIPGFAPDGRLVEMPGFDTTSGLLYHPSVGLAVPAISLNPTGVMVEAAIDLLLNDVLRDFPFASDADRANALACILLPVVRDLISGPTPLHLIEKPQPGTGATLFVDIIREIIGHEAVIQITEAGDQDEWRKRLTSALLDAPQMLVVDNVQRTLDSSALASAITATSWKDRVLGESRIVTAPVSCAWFATGE
jgi:putative DNA primase/helicase